MSGAWYYDKKPSNENRKFNYNILRFLGMNYKQARVMRDWRKSYINRYLLETDILFEG